jgi:serine/threonine protein kinase
MQELAPVSISGYKIIEKLGEGPSGQVFKAWDEACQRTVALKLFKPELTDQAAFLAQCRPAINSLSENRHPNVCSIFGVHRNDTRYVLVMEYLQGATLREIVSLGLLDNNRFLDIVAQIATGLKHAYELGVTHGNLKPSNITFTGEKVVKIMDFGLSCFAGGRAVSGECAFEMFHYLAPEQIRGEPATPLSDMFALGVLCFESLTGRRPFSGDSRETLTHSILHDKPDFQIMASRGIPGDTILLIEKLLAKNPENRFGGAAELLVTLQEMQSFEQKSPTRKFLQVKPQTARQYLLISLLAALLLVLWYVLTTLPHNR